MAEVLHPCFDETEFGYRFHLPIAPKCSTKCNFCKRMISDSYQRPGVTSEVLDTQDIEKYINQNISRYPKCRIIGIAGPGDPLSNPVEVFEAYNIISNNYPNYKKCMCTNGFYLSKYKDEFVESKLDYITVTLNSRNPITLSKIYDFLEYEGKIYKGVEMGILISKLQDEALKIIRSINGIKIKINVVVIPEINDSELDDIINYANEFNVNIINLIPVIAVKGTKFENIKMLSKDELIQIKDELREKYPNIKFKNNCQRCRADACGGICSKQSVS